MAFLKATVSLCFLVSLASCGSISEQNYQLSNSSFASDDCIKHLSEYAEEAAVADERGRFQATTKDGAQAFKVKVTWTPYYEELNSLIAIDPVNKVSLEFYSNDGDKVANAEVTNFEIAMDMGNMVHTNNTCMPDPVASQKTENSDPFTLSMDTVNLSMGSRQINKWFIHKLEASVDGVTGKIDRINIPHKVERRG